MKRISRMVAATAAVALFAAACSDAPDEGGDDETPTEAMSEEGSETEGSETEGSEPADGGDTEYAACQVTDTGGVDDRSFNQTAFKGIEDAEADLGVEGSVLESQSGEDFEPNINAFLEQGCDLIITVGFLLGDATAASAEANPDQNFAIVDVDFFDGEAGEDIVYDNVAELNFATDEAAFLAGYLSAGMTESGIIATYGGIQIPPVTIFMDGFLAGALYYNQENGTDVQVLGWDGSDGEFTGDFEDQTKGRAATETFIQNGADIIMPVAGPVGQGSGVPAQEAGAKLIWVDNDGFESVPQFSDVILTSVLKNIDVAVFDTIAADLDGAFPSGLYTGTLANDGVGLAPFHEFEDDVPSELADALDTIRQGIIDGEISVSPADYS